MRTAVRNQRVWGDYQKMPKKDPVVHWRNTILCYETLKFGGATTGPTPTPISILIPGLLHPPIHRSMLHSSCSIYSSSGPSRATVGGTKMSPQTNDGFRNFGPGASTIARSDLEEVNAGWVVCFGIPKWNAFDTVVAPGWEAVVLRLFW